MLAQQLSHPFRNPHPISKYSGSSLSSAIKSTSWSSGREAAGNDLTICVLTTHMMDGVPGCGFYLAPLQLLWTIGEQTSRWKVYLYLFALLKHYKKVILGSGGMV